MTDASLKDTFNELAALEQFMDRFAQRIPFRDKLQVGLALTAYKLGLPWQKTLTNPAGTEAEIAKKLEAGDAGSDEYTVLVASGIRAVKRDGPESKGYEDAIHLYRIFLRHADENTDIMMQIVGRERLASFAPDDNRTEIKSLAARHNLGALHRLLD